MDYNIYISGDIVKIYINKLLHYYTQDKIISIHSWNDEDKWYKIKITTKKSRTILVYDTFEKWENILSLLNKL